MNKKHYFKTCEYCGARLDPGEKCDCRAARAERKPEAKEAEEPPPGGTTESNPKEDIYMAKQIRRFWNGKDTDALIRMKEQGKTNRQIALALGRTLTAVQHKVSALGLAGLPEDPEAQREDAYRQLEMQVRSEAKQPGQNRSINEIVGMIDELNTALGSSKRKLEASQRAQLESMDLLNQAIAEQAKALKAQSDEISALKERLFAAETYIAQKPLWRLFHRYERGGV